MYAKYSLVASQCTPERDLVSINIEGGVVAPGLINVNSLGVQEIDQESTSNDGTIGGSTAELANVVAANGIIYNSKHHYAAAVSPIIHRYRTIYRPNHAIGRWCFDISHQSQIKHSGYVDVLVTRVKVQR